MTKQAYIWVSVYSEPEVSISSVLYSCIHCVVETSVVKRCVDAMDIMDIIPHLQNCAAWHPSSKAFYVRVSGQDIASSKTIASKWLSNE